MNLVQRHGRVYLNFYHRSRGEQEEQFFAISNAHLNKRDSVWTDGCCKTRISHLTAYHKHIAVGCGDDWARRPLAHLTGLELTDFYDACVEELNLVHDHEPPLIDERTRRFVDEEESS